MTDSKTPEWAEAAAVDAINYTGVCTLSGRDFDEVAGKISQALLSAYARGRKEGIEEAAKVAASGKIYSHVTTGEPPTVRPIEHRDLIATAIRQLLGVKG